MTDQEVRVACVQAASVTPGNPNHVQMAREYYEFVMEGVDKDPIVAVKVDDLGETRTHASGKKTRK